MSRACSIIIAILEIIVLVCGFYFLATELESGSVGELQLRFYPAYIFLLTTFFCLLVAANLSLLAGAALRLRTLVLPWLVAYGCGQAGLFGAIVWQAASGSENQHGDLALPLSVTAFCVHLVFYAIVGLLFDELPWDQGTKDRRQKNLINNLP